MSTTTPEPLDPSFQISLPSFEGPLDLLLHLIRKHELDILDLPIAFVTERYLSYVTIMEQLDLDIASEYLVMAATLAHIKSKMLLPQEPEDQPDEESSEEELDPRAELIRRLLEYQKYKNAAEQLGARGIAGRDVFLRGSDAPEASGPAPLASTSLFKLLDAFQGVLKRAKADIAFEITSEGVSIQDRMRELVDLLRERREVTFEQLFDDQVTVYDLVITFMALLEMAKRRLVRIYQADPHSPIHLRSTVLGEDGEASSNDYSGAWSDDDAPPEAAPVEAPVEAPAEPVSDAERQPELALEGPEAALESDEALEPEARPDSEEEALQELEELEGSFDAEGALDPEALELEEWLETETSLEDEPAFETESTVDAAFEPEPGTEAASDGSFESRLGVEAAPDASSQSDSGIEAAPDGSFQSESGIEAAPDASFQFEPGIEAAPDALFQSEPGIEAAPDGSFQSESGIEAAPDGSFQSESSAEAAPDAALAPDASAEAAPGAALEPEAHIEAAPDAALEPEASVEAALDTALEPEALVEARPDAALEPDASVEAGPDAALEAESGVGAAPDASLERHPGIDASPEGSLEPESRAEAAGPMPPWLTQAAPVEERAEEDAPEEEVRVPRADWLADLEASASRWDEDAAPNPEDAAEEEAVTEAPEEKQTDPERSDEDDDA